MEIARYPRASIYPIVQKLGASGRKRVGFVMVGGTHEQFVSHLKKHRQLAQARGYLRGTCVHAVSGSIDF